MLTIVLLTIGIVAALMLGMGVGVIFSNKPLKGSCGGVGNSCACEEAGTPGACMDPAAEGAKGLGSGFRAPNEVIGLDSLRS